MTSSHSLKVGIDFGTTYSGVAWWNPKKPEEVNIINNWDGGQGTCDKVPSQMIYNGNTVERWGYEVNPGEEHIGMMKLGLDTEKDRYGVTGCAYSQNPGTQSYIAGKKPVDLVTDYLRCLGKHISNILEEKYSEPVMRGMKIHYILTVPAIWSDVSKNLTLQAARSAGLKNMESIELMSEPDAAAAWTLLKDLPNHTLKPKDAFLIVDCGGGTVDLISYEVVRSEPLAVKECVRGTGALCGSIYLNEAFEQLVKTRFKDKGYFVQMDEEGRQAMRRDFENRKREFSENGQKIFRCFAPGVPDDEKAGVKRNMFIMTREDMENIFDPTIKKIQTLVHEQIKMIRAQGNLGLKLAAVLLVGGFGASKYLLQALKRDLETIPGYPESPFHIMNPVNAWSAVVRGAALGIDITSRRARLHYGTLYNGYFKNGVDPQSDLYYDQFTGQAMCRNCMHWSIKQGDEVANDKPARFSLIRRILLDWDLTFTDGLYVTDLKTAPRYLNEAGNDPPRKLCEIVSNLNTVPKNLFKSVGGDKPHHIISFDLVMTLKSAMLSFHLEFDGKPFGSVTVKFEQE